MTDGETKIINVLLDMTDVLRGIAKHVGKPEPEPAPAPAPARFNEGFSTPAYHISKLVALIVTENPRYEKLSRVTEAVDWLLENDRPGLWLHETTRNLMDRQRAGRKKEMP